jgi:predicted RNA-binding Zn-ribbon protein involved in translation (DUF1610 family)
MTWVHKLRLRVFALVVAAALTVLGLASVVTVPIWPVVGVAFAAVALVVNRVASRLDGPTCLACGADLSDQALGEHGVMCPSCGSISDVTARPDRRSIDA